MMFKAGDRVNVVKAVPEWLVWTSGMYALVNDGKTYVVGQYQGEYDGHAYVHLLGAGWEFPVAALAYAKLRS